MASPYYRARLNLKAMMTRPSELRVNSQRNFVTMNLMRRSPYTMTATQTAHPSSTAAFILPVVVTSALTITPMAYGYGYAAPGITSLPSSAPDQYAPSSSSTSTAIPIAHLEVIMPSQGSIIAISIICGLLLLALLFALLVVIGKRYEFQHLRLDIEGGSGGAHHRKRRRHRSERMETEYSGSEGDRPPGMNPVFFTPGSRPNGPGNLKVAQHYFPDPRVPVQNPLAGQGEGGPIDPRIHHIFGVGQPQPVAKGDIEDVELSETSTKRAGGTRTARPTRSDSENRRRSSKASSSRTRGRHQGE